MPLGAKKEHGQTRPFLASFGHFILKMDHTDYYGEPIFANAAIGFSQSMKHQWDAKWVIVEPCGKQRCHAICKFVPKKSHCPPNFEQ